MRHWFHRFFVEPPVKYTEKADLPEFWSVEDAQWLNQLLKSQNGQKLKVKLVNYAIQSACAAVRNEEKCEYRNGEASGIFKTIDAIELMAGIPENIEQTEIVEELS